jgi:ribosomal-protein-alanine N-acetyltransferase
MQTALAEAGHAGASRVFLEVRQSNTDARAFYATLGFLEVGRRRGYYRDPAEDALVLSRSVSAP